MLVGKTTKLAGAAKVAEKTLKKKKRALTLDPDTATQPYTTAFTELGRLTFSSPLGGPSQATPEGGGTDHINQFSKSTDHIVAPVEPEQNRRGSDEDCSSSELGDSVLLEAAAKVQLQEAATQIQQEPKHEVILDEASVQVVGPDWAALLEPPLT